MSVEEEEWKDVNHYYTICRTDIEGPLPQFVDVPCNTIDHVETELWERLVYKHPISKLEYQIHGKSNANRLETRVEHGSVYNWVKAESEQVLLELPTVSKFSQGEDLSMLLSVTTTNNKTTIIALSSQLLERIDFALLEKNQFSSTHVVIGFWDRTMHATCNTVNSVMGNAHSSRFSSFVSNGITITARFDIIYTSKERKLKDLSNTNRANDPRLRPIVCVFLFEVLLLTCIAFVLLY